jgi:hypothetical protein
LPSAQASFVIDNFTTVTNTITQTGNGTTTSAAMSGSGILGTRTISLTVGSPLTSASAAVGLSTGLATAGFNGNYSSPNRSSNFTLTENFSSVNATGDGDLALSFLIGSSLGTTVTITANGTSTFTFTDGASPAGTDHTILFSSFSDPTAFANLTSLSFTETFPGAGLSGPSVSFSGPMLLDSLNPSTVPEPATVVMIAQAGIASVLFGLRRRFTRRKQAVA